MDDFHIWNKTSLPIQWRMTTKTTHRGMMSSGNQREERSVHFLYLVPSSMLQISNFRFLTFVLLFLLLSRWSQGANRQSSSVLSAEKFAEGLRLCGNTWRLIPVKGSVSAALESLRASIRAFMVTQAMTIPLPCAINMRAGLGCAKWKRDRSESCVAFLFCNRRRYHASVQCRMNCVFAFLPWRSFKSKLYASGRIASLWEGWYCFIFRTMLVISAVRRLFGIPVWEFIWKVFTMKPTDTNVRGQIVGRPFLWRTIWNYMKGEFVCSTFCQMFHLFFLQFGFSICHRKVDFGISGNTQERGLSNVTSVIGRTHRRAIWKNTSWLTFPSNLTSVRNVARYFCCYLMSVMSDKFTTGRWWWLTWH